MNRYSIVSQGRKTTIKNMLGILSILLFASVSHNASAITAAEVMRNVLDVYEDIEDYTAVVYTYKASSMDVSESVFESQQPIIAFNIFFRKQDEHVVKPIGRAHRAIFRIELLTALGRLKNFVPKLRGREQLFGQNCYVLEVSSPDKPDELVTLFLSPKNWAVLKLTLSIDSIDLIVTQFKYAETDRRKRHLPTETRSLFPLTRQVLINRIGNYQINTGLPSEIFEKKRGNER